MLVAPSPSPSESPSSAPTIAPSDVMHWLTAGLSVAVQYAPLAAVAIALVSLGFAISSRRLAGQAQELAKQKDARQAPLLDVDALEAVQHVAVNGDQRIDVHVQITNRSEI